MISRSHQTLLNRFFPVVRSRSLFPVRIFPDTKIPDQVLVNRERELALLQSAVDKCLTDEHTGWIIPITGVSGVGKSALLRLFYKKAKQMRNRTFYLPSAKLEENKKLETKITRSPAPRLILLDQFEDILDKNKFLKRIKYMLQNIWKRTVVILTTTPETYEHDVIGLIRKMTALEAVITHVHELKPLSPLNPTQKAQAVRNWLELNPQLEKAGVRISVRDVVNDDAIRWLVANTPEIGDVLRVLNDKIYQVSQSADPGSLLPLQPDDLKDTIPRVAEKVLIFTTRNVNCIRKTKVRLRQKLCDDPARQDVVEALDKGVLVIDGIDSNNLARVVSGHENNRITKDEAMGILSESPFAEHLGMSRKTPNPFPNQQEIIANFNAEKQAKSEIGAEAYRRILEAAGVTVIKGLRLRRGAVSDLVIEKNGERLYVELQFISGSKTCNFMRYIMKKIQNYYGSNMLEKAR